MLKLSPPPICIAYDLKNAIGAHRWLVKCDEHGRMLHREMLNSRVCLKEVSDDLASVRISLGRCIKKRSPNMELWRGAVRGAEARFCKALDEAWAAQKAYRTHVELYGSP